MSKKVVMTESKLVDLIYNIVDSSIKELKINENKSPKKVVKKPAKKVVKITEAKLVNLIDKIVKKQIAAQK